MEINVKALSESYIWRLDLLMILVSLGTQDREFPRLLEAVEKQIELGNIKEKVIVQAGVTNFKSDKMEIFDLIPTEEFNKLMDEARILITHGGVGTIVGALKKHKKIIAAARLSKYKEHQNDHQTQIIKEFVNKHYILELKDFSKLDILLKEIETFEPHEYKSNTPNMIKKLNQFIENSTSNKSYRLYLFYSFLAMIIEIISLNLLYPNLSRINTLIINSFLTLIFYYLMYFIFFKKDKNHIPNHLIFTLFLSIKCFLCCWLFKSHFIIKSLIFSLIFIIGNIPFGIKNID